MVGRLNLNKIIQWAKNELSLILDDIPDLKGNVYLVYSSPSGQCNLTANRLEIYRSFPAFFIKDGNHSKINELIQKNEGEATKGLLENLVISPDVQIEFRFEAFNNRLLETLKKHPKVKQPEKMMRSAYIRVILSPVNEIDISEHLNLSPMI